MEELREERRQQGGGREDKGWMNNAFAKGRKQHAAGGGNLQRGKKIRLEKGCPLTLRSAPEISVYLSLSLSISLLTLLSSLSAPSIGKGMGAGRGVRGSRRAAKLASCWGPEVVSRLYLGLWVNVAVCCGTAS